MVEIRKRRENGLEERLPDHILELNKSVFYCYSSCIQNIRRLFVLKNSKVQETRFFSEKGKNCSAISKHFILLSFIATTIYT